MADRPGTSAHAGELPIGAGRGKMDFKVLGTSDADAVFKDYPVHTDGRLRSASS